MALNLFQPPTNVTTKQLEKYFYDHEVVMMMMQAFLPSHLVKPN
jgi:hypothetical protein